MPDEETCGVWGVVDFGKGPVDVACTRTGPHDDHICSVVLEVTENVSVEELTEDFKHKNIFEGN